MTFSSLQKHSAAMDLLLVFSLSTNIAISYIQRKEKKENLKEQRTNNKNRITRTRSLKRNSIPLYRIGRIYVVLKEEFSLWALNIEHPLFYAVCLTVISSMFEGVCYILPESYVYKKEEEKCFCYDCVIFS